MVGFIRDEYPAAIRCDGNTLRLDSHRDAGNDLAAGDIHDGSAPRIFVRHEQALLVDTQVELLGIRAGREHAYHLVGCGIDDGDTVGAHIALEFRAFLVWHRRRAFRKSAHGDEKPCAGAIDLHAARALADIDGCDDLRSPRVDHRDAVAILVGHVGALATRRHGKQTSEQHANTNLAQNDRYAPMLKLLLLLSMPLCASDCVSVNSASKVRFSVSE